MNGKPIRLVIDTNALIAARFKATGLAARLLDLCIAGEVQALITPEIECENRAILKKVKPSNAYWDRLERFYDGAETVGRYPTMAVPDDPEDSKFLECAVGGDADYLITSDHHLLAVDGQHGIRICKSHDFFSENSWLKQRA